MANSYLDVDREQQYLLPPDIRDWLEPGHLAWLVVSCVEEFDTSALHARHPNAGQGRRAYNPDMLLALLIYGYCTGVRSSRDIERHCRDDVAFRVITANSFPDHSTISRFRKTFMDSAQSLFCDVLELVNAHNVLDLSVVAIDGTKMAANASPKNNRNRAQLEKLVAAMFEEAEAIDAKEDERYGDKRGDELPDDLADPAKRKAAIQNFVRKAKQAQARLDQREEQRNGESPSSECTSAAERVAEMEQRVEFERKRDEQRRASSMGRPLHPDGSCELRRALKSLSVAQQRLNKFLEARAQERNTKRVNLVDVDSWMMPSTKGWVQGYNAQAICDRHGFVLVAGIWDNPNDGGAFVPLVQRMLDNVGLADIGQKPGVVLGDAGYSSKANIDAAGPDRLIADTKSWKLKQPVPEGDCSPFNEHRKRMRSEDARKLYALRKHLIEPVFGNIKSNKGFRSFLMRGLAAANGEWNLMMTAHNLTKLHRMKVG